jgi:hypothetical protein
LYRFNERLLNGRRERNSARGPNPAHACKGAILSDSCAEKYHAHGTGEPVIDAERRTEWHF